jgi:ubiquinone/menaquinone biosynthesis C-methylase UbiE
VQQASGSEVHALDPNVKRIQFIQEHYPKLKPCLSASDAIPYADAFFDKVYSTAAVHHFPDQHNILRNPDKHDRHMHQF